MALQRLAAADGVREASPRGPRHVKLGTWTVHVSTRVCTECMFCTTYSSKISRNLHGEGMRQAGFGIKRSHGRRAQLPISSLLTTP